MACSCLLMIAMPATSAVPLCVVLAEIFFTEEDAGGRVTSARLILLTVGALVCLAPAGSSAVGSLVDEGLDALSITLKVLSLLVPYLLMSVFDGLRCCEERRTLRRSSPRLAFAVTAR